MAKARKARRSGSKKRYIFKLFVTGATPRSQRAITNLNSICDEYFAGNCNVEVVDVYRSPGAAREANVIAAPTLIREMPLPARRMIGDLSDRERVLLLLKPKSKADNA